ncbi:MAG: protein arginine kinase [Lachnospiraceae bacterium]
MLRWFEEAGAGADVIISSRVRLARNISAYPFSTKITSEQTDKMLSDVGKVLIKDVKTSGYRDYILEDLDHIEKEALVERNVITKYLAEQDKAMFFVSEDEKNTVMLNEEDHIRIQCISAGMNLEECYKRAEQMDQRIGEQVTYAYDDNFGYLTTCPSNVGTGMKASLMLHLPALSNTKKIQDLMNEVGRFGINMRGMYGEDGSGCGHIYQISNQKTLGQSEQEIINNLENLANQICEQERQCRRQVLKKDRLKLEDEIYKSYGILKYSRMLKYKDAMLFLSELRLGLSLGLLQFQEKTDFIVYQLMIGVQPANLKLIMGNDYSETELEQKRAEFIRENLPLIN